jgi:hypothetical protein
MHGCLQRVFFFLISAWNDMGRYWVMLTVLGVFGIISRGFFYDVFYLKLYFKVYYLY